MTNHGQYWHYAADYSNLQREAHRRVFPWLDAPLVGRHLTLVPSDREKGMRKRDLVAAFERIVASLDPSTVDDGTADEYHLPPSISARSTTEWKFERTEQVDFHDDYPINLQLTKPYLSRSIPLATKDSQFVNLTRETADSDILRSLLRADCYSEHFTITQLFELRMEENREFFEKLGYPSHLAKAAREFLGIEERQTVTPEFDRSEKEREDLLEIKPFLYTKIWNQLDLYYQLAGRLVGEDTECFKVLADFRMVCPTCPGRIYPKTELGTEPWGPPRIQNPENVAATRFRELNMEAEKLRRKHSYTGGNRVRQDAGPPTLKPAFEDHDGSAAKGLAQFWPLWSDADHQLGKKEVAASTFLDGSVLYISSLGFEAAGSRNGHTPLTFVMVTSLTDPWQFGRLVFRKLMLGTTRVMAIRQIGHLYLAAWHSDQVKREAMGIIENAPRWIRRSAKAARRLSADLASIEKHGVPLKESQKPEAPGKSYLVGGLSHRIARSEYFSRNFRQRVNDLREDRISGYQSYQEVMRRRLYATFEMIESISEKVQDARDAVAQIDRQVRRKQLTLLNWLVGIAAVSAIGSFLYDFELFRGGDFGTVTNSARNLFEWLATALDRI